jgi:DNA invertase Pin-like site-specific DNA recombinase
VTKGTLAGLVRVSHMGARKAGAQNVHADREQVEDVQRGAREHGYRLHMLPAELDISGGLALEQRPSLIAAIQGVEAGAYQGIIVAYLSRLGRNVREQLRAWDRVEGAGGRIIVVREGIDTSTPSGRLHRNMLLSIAEHEREQHAERFENLRRWATQAGIWQRRQTPTGYVKDPASRKLVPGPDALRVRWAFRQRAAGATVSSLARELQMTASGVRALLRNRVYLGELRVGEHVNAQAHPPLVSAGEFDAAQLSVARPARSLPAPALLAGLARCAGCGHVMSRSRQAAVVYCCARHHSGGECPAPAAVTARLLDEHVETVALAQLDRLALSASERGGGEQLRDALDVARRELDDYLQATSALGDVEAFRAGALARQQAVAVAQAELARHMAQAPALPADMAPRAAWELMDGAQRNVLLRALLECVIVARGGGRGSRTPLLERVQVIAFGAGLDLPRRRAGVAAGIRPLGFLDGDDERVLRVD